MLKIKNNVSFKKLKKFGFEENEVNDKTLIRQWGHKSFQCHIVVSNDKTKMLYLSLNNGESWLPIDNVLFDLIKSDLVEIGE